jgi:hypothetical protein
VFCPRGLDCAYSAPPPGPGGGWRLGRTLAADADDKSPGETDMTALGRLAAVALLAAGLAACTSPGDATRGSASDAEAMVERAIEAYDANGAAAFADMTAPSTSFVDRDLYVFVIGPDYRIVAHGNDAARIGEDITVMVDSQGKAFGNEMVVRADSDGEWVDYTWADPLTGNEEPKSSYLVKHDGYIFGSGIYKVAAPEAAQ